MGGISKPTSSSSCTLDFRQNYFIAWFESRGWNLQSYSRQPIGQTDYPFSAYLFVLTPQKCNISHITGNTMTVQPKPIPALYTVYILRSTVRHASLYIGSTPNPPRRLSQHNGLSKGGAARTSREKLRPWEMVGLVSGFPSMTAALKFE